MFDSRNLPSLRSTSLPTRLWRYCLTKTLFPWWRSGRWGWGWCQGEQDPSPWKPTKHQMSWDPCSWSMGRGSWGSHRYCHLLLSCHLYHSNNLQILKRNCEKMLTFLYSNESKIQTWNLSKKTSDRTIIQSQINSFSFFDSALSSER